MKKRAFFIRDPLASFLTEKMRLRMWGGGILAFLISAAYVVILPSVFGILDDALADSLNLGVLLAISPAVWMYYLWQAGGIPEMFATLEQSAREPQQMAGEIQRRRERIAKLKWIAVIPVAAAIGLSAINIRLSFMNFGGTWLTHNWQMIAALQAIRLPVFYMVAMIVIRLALSSIMMNQVVSRQPLKIILLHPDGRGGVNGLGRYALASASVVPIAGLYLGLVWAREGLPALAPGGLYFPAVLIYLVASSILLSLPVLNVHDQMQTSKSRLLGEIAELFEQEYATLARQLHQNILAPDVAVRLRAFKKMYQTTEKAPVWPMDLGLFSQFTLAVILPLFIPILLRFLAALVSQ